MPRGMDIEIITRFLSAASLWEVISLWARLRAEKFLDWAERKSNALHEWGKNVRRHV